MGIRIKRWVITIFPQNNTQEAEKYYEAAKEADTVTKKDHGSRRTGLAKLERSEGRSGQVDGGRKAVRGEKDTGEALEEKREYWSFPGQKPPNDAAEIGRKKVGDDVHIYYKDKYGNYWFASERILAFDREMQAAEKRRKEERRRRWKEEKRSWH
jgi:hypothetical protein